MKLLFTKFFFFLQYLKSKKYPQMEESPDSPEKILLIMCKWIGDTFWDLQGIPALQKQFPNAKIHVITKPFSKFLFVPLLPESQIHVSTQILSDCRRETFHLKTWKQELALAESIQPDLLIDFTETPFSAVFSVRIHSFRKRNKNATLMGLQKRLLLLLFFTRLKMDC